MEIIKKHYCLLEILFVGTFICIFLWLLMSGVFRESGVYDEKLHLAAGYTFLTKHDFRVEPFNPPLAREIIALPLLFAFKFINDPILLAPRLIVVVTAVLFSAYFYWFSKKILGRRIALLSLFLFILEPEILAHGHYTTTDLIFAFLFFISISFYFLWRNSLNLKKISILAIIVGLTLAVKISALPFLFFSFLIILFIQKKEHKNILHLTYWRNKIKFLLIIIGLSGLTIWFTYFLTMEPLLGYRFDPNRIAVKLAVKNSIINFALNVPMPLGSYVSTVKQVVLYNYSPLYNKTSFLNGEILQNGSFYFFPIAFLLKTPLPLIILFILALFAVVKKNRNNLFLLAPIISIFASSSLSTLNFGIRYILPAYPFIILLSSQVVKLKFKFKNLLIVLLIIWYILGIINVFPHYISFFNEFAGGSKNGYKYLVDSNFDWGQGLIDLKRYQTANKINNLQLAYFGSVEPEKYDIQYERIKDLSINDHKKVEALKFDNSHTVAISATCWYFCGYYKNIDLKKNSPVAIVGGSILIFKK